MIGVSTLAFGKSTKEEILLEANKNAWIIEFSSSFPYDKNMVSFFESIKIKRFAHNYFPAPKIPFVINLASSNEKIRKRSVDHCIQGLQLTKKCGAPFFSAHAGFCIDPDPEQLGNPLDVNIPINRDLNWELFIFSLKEILREAKKLDISFLVENNVTTEFNIRDDGQEVLLCSRPEEIVRLIKEINSPELGLLLDTAHLKVSSKALNFSLKNSMRHVMPYVRCIHHSDNDGNRDTNDSITQDYWFLPYMKDFKSAVHILEVKNLDQNSINNQLKILSEA